jgi:ribosome recycling factor
MNKLGSLARDEFAAAQPLRQIASVCTTGACPTVYEANDDCVIVQGYVVSAEELGVDVPDGETLVKVPLALLTEAVRRLH